MKFTIDFGEHGRFATRKGANILQVALRADLPIHHVCGGKASCGTCRVQVEDGLANLSRMEPKEAARLPDERLRAGWRLACQARLLAPGTVRVKLWEQGGAERPVSTGQSTPERTGPPAAGLFQSGSPTD